MIHINYCTTANHRQKRNNVVRKLRLRIPMGYKTKYAYMVAHIATYFYIKYFI